MRLFLAAFFLYLAFKAGNDLKTLRDAFAGIGIPFIISGLLAYFYDGLLFALSFSFLLKREWLKPASLLGILAIGAILGVFIFDFATGGSSCKTCPAASKDAVSIFFLLASQIIALFFCLILFLKRGSNAFGE
jgi:hypothetical protein